MPIYVTKNGRQSGPYEDHIVIDQLRSGVLSPNDMGIRHGDSSWQRLGELFPEAVRFEPMPPPMTPAAPVASASAVSSASPAAKKGGCLKWGLIGSGILLLLLGVAAAAGSRFVPSPSCDIARADEDRIGKLKRDIEKAKSDFDYDVIGPKALELESATAGYEVSKRHCDSDKQRDNIILGAGVLMGGVGLLMAIVGLFLGRRR